VLSMDQAGKVIGATAYTADGDRIGRIGQLFLDDATKQPEWITVSTGFFGTKESFVPLAEAKVEGDRVLVPYTKDQVKGAPRVDVEDGHLSENEEIELYRYYGLPESGPFAGETGTSDTSGPVGAGSDRSAGYAVGTSGEVEDVHTGSGPGRSAGDAAATEEQSRAGAEDRRRGRSRLRKYSASEGDEPVR
jgi:hypothetical protein